MTLHTQLKEPQVQMPTRDEARDLLCRYPHLREDEVKRLLRFMRKGRHLDVGLITGDEQLKPQLDIFMADHAQHFQVSVGEASTLIAAIAAFLAACWFVWEAIKPATLTV